MNKKTIASMLFVIAAIPTTAQELVWQKCNESLPASTRIMPVGCQDNNHQEGLPFDSGVEATIDGNLSTNWHTAYYPEHRKVTPETPAELVYEFDGKERIDRMVYVPRQVGYNGNVTQAEVYSGRRWRTVYRTLRLAARLRRENHSFPRRFEATFGQGSRA